MTREQAERKARRRKLWRKGARRPRIPSLAVPDRPKDYVWDGTAEEQADWHAATVRWVSALGGQVAEDLRLLDEGRRHRSEELAKTIAADAERQRREDAEEADRQARRAEWERLVADRVADAAATERYLKALRDCMREAARRLEEQRRELAEWHEKAKARWAKIGEQIYRDDCQFERLELERRGAVRGKMPR